MPAPPRILGVIPARLASTRLPGKVLREIAGRPMLAWVVEAALACPQLDHLIVATDAEEVADLCRRQGWPVQLTSPALPSGSDRVHAVALLHPAEIYINLQGDEPLLLPAHLSTLLAPFCDPGVLASTLKVHCPPAEISNPNTVKVVTAHDHRALYFSRAAIPHDRDRGLGPGRDGFHLDGDASAAPVWKHLGIYAYRAATLARFHGLAPSPLEQTERLEQLRFLENNIPLHVFPTPHNTVGVDTEADLLHVQTLLQQRSRSS